MVLFSVLALTCMQGSSIAQNMTTNEMTNAFKYQYLKDEHVREAQNPESSTPEALSPK